MGDVPTWLRVVSPITNLASLGGSGKKPKGDDKHEDKEIDSYKRGGKVKRTGAAKLHRGELVIPKGKVKTVKKAMRDKKRKKGRGM